MTKKADFKAEEWTRVLEGPPIAGLLVIEAERGGTFRESIGMGKAYQQAQEKHASTELVEDVINSRPDLEKDRFSSAEEFKAQGADVLRQNVGLVESKATAEEAEEYKRFVLTVAEAAARAHKEGGVLGIGGKPVSDAENAVLDEIASTLGIAREPQPPEGT